MLAFLLFIIGWFCFCVFGMVMAYLIVKKGNARWVLMLDNEYKEKH